MFIEGVLFIKERRINNKIILIKTIQLNDPVMVTILLAWNTILTIQVFFIDIIFLEYINPIIIVNSALLNFNCHH